MFSCEVYYFSRNSYSIQYLQSADSISQNYILRGKLSVKNMPYSVSLQNSLKRKAKWVKNVFQMLENMFKNFNNYDQFELKKGFKYVNSVQRVFFPHKWTPPYLSSPPPPRHISIEWSIPDFGHLNGSILPSLLQRRITKPCSFLYELNFIFIMKRFFDSQMQRSHKRIYFPCSPWKSYLFFLNRSFQVLNMIAIYCYIGW